MIFYTLSNLEVFYYHLMVSWKMHCDERGGDMFSYAAHEMLHNDYYATDYMNCDNMYLSLMGYSRCSNQCEYDTQYCLIDKDGRILTSIPFIHWDDVEEFKNSVYLFCGKCAFSVEIPSQ